jgi:hypothetical protein
MRIITNNEATRCDTTTPIIFDHERFLNPSNAITLQNVCNRIQHADRSAKVRVYKSKVEVLKPEVRKRFVEGQLFENAAAGPYNECELLLLLSC